MPSYIDLFCGAGGFSKGFDDEGNILFANNVTEKLRNKLKLKKLNNAFLDEKRRFYLKWNRENWFNNNPNRHQ